MSTHRQRVLAEALADAFLVAAADDDWHVEGLAAQVGEVLQRRPRWRHSLAREVLERFTRPPVDAPRELAAHVARSATLGRAFEKAYESGRPAPRARHVVAVPTGMGRRRWLVPPLDTLADLADFLGEDIAHLEWLADVRGVGRRSTAPALATYRHTWLPRGQRSPRLLEAPRPRLNAAQRTVLQGILAVVPTHDAAHGFVPGRSAVTGASQHSGAATVLTLDLESFFASVTAARVYGVFRSAGYPESVAHTLAGLCTTSAPIAVLRTMPTGGDPETRFRLRSWLTHPHLPQGAPTSPALANLCAFVLDRRLAGLAGSRGLTYTRYADDLCFSGSLGSPDSLVELVTGIVREEGFRLNENKSKLRRSHQRQQVTGIVVNEGTNLARTEYERLKAILHDAAVNGPATANRHGHSNFAAHLLGRISWVGSLNAARGAKLLAAYERIDWGAGLTTP